MPDRLTARGRDGEGHLIAHDVFALEPGEDADAVFAAHAAAIDDAAIDDEERE